MSLTADTCHWTPAHHKAPWWSRWVAGGLIKCWLTAAADCAALSRSVASNMSRSMTNLAVPLEQPTLLCHRRDKIELAELFARTWCAEITTSTYASQRALPAAKYMMQQQPCFIAHDLRWRSSLW